MPEHSETTPTPSTSESTERFTQVLTLETGLQIVVESAASRRLQSATWIVTTTTPTGTPEVWRVQATKDATP